MAHVWTNRRTIIGPSAIIRRVRQRLFDGEPTVADLVKPGDVIRPSYGDTVYDVVSITEHDGRSGYRGDPSRPTST